MSEYRYVGKSVTKVDALERVTGKAAFGADTSMPGMLHSKVLRSPHPHARIKRMEHNAVAFRLRFPISTTSKRNLRKGLIVWAESDKLKSAYPVHSGR